MAKGSFLRALGSFAAVILSIILVVLCIVAPVYFSVTSIITPKSVSKVIQKMDFETLITESDDMNETFEKLGLDSDDAEEFIKSPEVTEVIENYSAAVTDTLQVLSKEEEFDASFLQDFVEENIDTLVDIAEEISPTGVEKEDLKEGLSQAIASQEEVFEELLPKDEITVNTSGNIDPLKAIRLVLSPTLTLIVVAALLVPVALICLLKFKRARCCIWLSVDFIICSLLLGGIALLGNLAFFKELLPTDASFGAQIINSSVSVVFNRVAISALVLIVLAALLLTAYFIIRAKVLNKAVATETEIETL